ncbi:hypothetical protein [Actinomadura rubrisoli]|uniref:Uncharacterized protein n=1 Tax=Actinomadura rubrisoli TaxID=2530368 RepID=A0A4R5BNH8_9ACTN|nr:hypothetical protein [Actinomadura rubrisoli]TDD86720.1 hypothetical protein E1298_17160 [Actinomadura rubrisoli]
MTGGLWTLDHDGHRLEVGTERTGWKQLARLYADGEQAGEATGGPLIKIPYGELTVQVWFDVRGLLDGQAARCHLAPPEPSEPSDTEGEEGKDDDADDGGGAEQGKIPFVPAEGTRAARREALALAHPALYASRHVVLATGKVLLPLLGLGALIKLLLAMVPWPDWSLPEIDPPSVPLPDVPWPDLPDVSLPLWLRVILATAKFWVPILFAIGVAAKEVERRKKQREQQEQKRQGQDDAEPAGPVSR